MNDADRSKAQLIDELRSTRQLLAELKGADRALRSLTHALGERVKELNCLYGISHLVEAPGISLPQILQGTAELIPPSWQFPDITVARITLDDWDYHTEGFQQGLDWRQTAKIMIEGRVRGAVEVSYVEERPESHEGPFLKEERSLIDAIAERLGRIAERTWAAEQLEASEERFKAQYKGLPIPVYTWQRAGDDFVLVDFNDAAEETTQGSVAGLLGSSARELYADAPDIVDDLQRCLTERRSFKREMLYRYRTIGRSRHLSVSYGFVPPDLVLVHTEDVTERRRAEQALQREQDFVTAVLDTAGALVVVLDMQGRIVRFNQACERTTGYTFDEVAGQRLWDLLIAPDEVDKVRAVFEELRVGHFPSEYTNYWLTKEGDHRLISWSNTALVDDEGLVEFVIGSGIDITDRERAERQHQTILKTAIDGFWICDAQGRILDVNDALCRMVGYERQDLLATSITDLEAVESPQEVARHIDAVLTQGYDRFESQLRHRDGRLIDIEASVSHLDAVRGRFFAFIRDITERKRAEIASRGTRDELERRVLERTAELGRANEALKQEIAEKVRAELALRESEELYRAMFEKNRAVQTLIDPGTGALVDANPAAVEFYGYSPEELKARTIMDIAKSPPEQALEELARVETEQRRYSPARHHLASGEVRDVEVHSSPIDVGGQRLLYSIVHDVTDRVLAQREIEQSHQRESVLNTLLRLSMEEIPLEEQLERALDEILSVPWLPVLLQGGIFLVGDEPEVLELRSQRGLGRALQRDCAQVAFGHCVCGRAAASGELVFASTVDERHETHYAGMAPHGHYCVPILSGERAIGTMVLYLEHGHRRDGSQEEFLQAVAHTLAGIIERKRAESERDATLGRLQESDQRLRELNLQLEDYGRNLEQRVAERTREIEQRRQVAESLRDMLAVLNSDRPVDEILELIVTEASRLLGSDTSAIFRLEPDQDRFVVQTGHGLAADVELAPGVCRTLSEGKPVAISKLDGAEVASARQALQGPHSPERGGLLAVPLIVRAEVYGGLVLHYSEPRPFTEEEVGLAVAFADQAALAIENSRLSQQARDAAILEERGRLARDLHDSVTQSLYSLTLLAEGWKRLAKAGRLEDADDPLGELGEIAQQALKEMRLMVHELRPPALEEEGLLGALHHRLAAVEKRAGVEARLMAEDVVELPPPVEEGLYRIAVEALNNALKHAAATRVTVNLRVGGETIELCVEDNGHGFDLKTVDESRGMGLASMKERAEKLGGRTILYSSPGGGTSVVTTIPVQANT